MTKSRWLVVGFAVAASLLSAQATAWAQAGSSPNTGAITFTGGLDTASVYVFRGFVQETDPAITLFPYGDIGIALMSGDGTVKSTVVNFGVWNSLNTGSSGTDGPSGHAHFEEQFYARVNMLFGGRMVVGAGYLARTSPNNMLDTTKEFQLKVAQVSRLNPYAFLASELNEAGQADGGASKGTYLELGAMPSFAVGRKLRLAVPTKVGLSVKDYYELAGADHTFGFFDVGAVVTLPLGTSPSRFGSWNVHGGGEIYLLGDALQPANRGDTSKAVGFVGIGLTY